MKIYNYEQGESEQGEHSCVAFYYILTIKRNAKEFTPILWINRQRDRVKRMLGNVEWSCHSCYELDSLDRIHLHTYIKTNKEIYFHKFKSKGWSIHFKQFPKEDLQTVIDYINKHKSAYDGDIKQMEEASQIYNSDPLSLFN